MPHIDTLQAFDNLVNSGVSEKEARAYVRNLESSFNKHEIIISGNSIKAALRDLEINLGNKIDTKFNILILGYLMLLFTKILVDSL